MRKDKRILGVAIVAVMACGLTTAAGETRDVHSGYAAPASFDITDALGEGGTCQVFHE